METLGRPSFFFLSANLAKSCLRGMFQKRGSLIGPIIGLAVYAFSIYRCIFLDMPPETVHTARYAVAVLYFIISLKVIASVPRPLRQAAALFRSFALPSRSIRQFLASFRSLPFVLVAVAFAPFAVKWGLAAPFAFATVLIPSISFLFFLSIDIDRRAPFKGQAFPFPLFMNLSRLFCRPGFLAIAYPVFAMAAIPISSLLNGENADNRLALLIGAELAASFLACHGADNSLKASFFLPYPFIFARWQVNFHSLSFLFLFSGRVASLIAMGDANGYAPWLLRLYACDSLFLPFIFDPSPLIGSLLFLPYVIFSAAFVPGQGWGIAALAALCVPAIISAAKEYRDNASVRRGFDERIDRV